MYRSGTYFKQSRLKGCKFHDRFNSPPLLLQPLRIMTTFPGTMLNMQKIPYVTLNLNHTYFVCFLKANEIDFVTFDCTNHTNLSRIKKSLLLKKN